MKKMIDRIDSEIVFYDDEVKKAAFYLGVDGETLEEVCDNANEKHDKESDFSDRYRVVEF